MIERTVLLVFLLLSAAGPARADGESVIVLDASGSMWGQIEGKTKIEIARQALRQVLGSVAPDQSIGLLAYGHRRKADCADIELLVPPAASSAGKITAAADAIKPKGKTPLSDAVLRAAETLRYTEDAATVILITDGLETCDRDPCALGETLAETGVDFTAHVVGFGLSAEEGKQVACLAENTGGMYLSASDAGQLAEALSQAVVETAPPAPAPEPDPAPPAEADLDAPGSVEQASRFVVTWDGPGDRYDRIQVFDPTARMGEGKVVRTATLQHGDFEERSVKMTAPAELGTVQLRYWDGRARRVLATRDLEVTEATVSVTAPETVEIAHPIEVEWVGPGSRNDAIQIYDPNASQGEGKILRKAPVHSGDLESRTLRLIAPAKPGEYVLRYWNADNKTVLAERSIDVVDADVALSAPDEIEAGRTIRVGWTGPGGRYDAVRIYDPNALNGDGKVVRDKRLGNDDKENQTVSLPAPAKPGTYELHYWNGENKAVLATRPIEVLEARVELTAPDSVERARRIDVGWAGPGGRYDSVRLYDPDGNNGNGRVVRDKRLRNDDFDNRRVELSAPADPGHYELHYWNGENKAVLATRPIEVTTSEVTLSAPEQVAAESAFVVEWIGPGAVQDDVKIVDADGRATGGRRLRNGDFDGRKVKLKAPKAPGRYELRYWNGENKAVLATRPIEVTAPPAGP